MDTNKHEFFNTSDFRPLTSTSVNSWLRLRLDWSPVYSFPIPNPFNPRNPRLKNSGRLEKIFRELRPEFPGMGSEDQKLQTKNQTRTRMKQTWNFKQRQRRSFYVLTVAGAHCPYRIQHPGSDDHYLSFVETLEPTLRRRRCMRFLPSFGLAQLIQHLSQARTRDH